MEDLTRRVGNPLPHSDDHAEQIRQLYLLGKQQQEIMASLLQGAKIILEFPDFHESGSLLLKKCKSLLGADCGFISLLIGEDQIGEVVVDQSSENNCLIQEKVPALVSAFLPEIQKNRETILENDFNSPGAELYLPEGQKVLRNLLVVPMVNQEIISGLFVLINKNGGFSMDDVSVTGAWAELASLASVNWNNIQELRKARQRAEESDRLKSAFLSNMSHEIRTPLNGILGFSELLKEEDLEPDERENFIRIINRNGEQLMSIINNILDISMIESGQMVLKRDKIDIKVLMKDVFELFQSPGLRQPDVQYILDSESCPTPMYIVSDPARLKQVLVNLVGNATKFTRKGHVLLGCRIHGDGENKEIVFYVEDTGPGIPQESLAQIFERFRQADNSLTRKVGGTGLGLAISKGLTELLGGRIEVHSTLGIGSTFKVHFPL